MDLNIFCGQHLTFFLALQVTLSLGKTDIGVDVANATNGCVSSVSLHVVRQKEAQNCLCRAPADEMNIFAICRILLDSGSWFSASSRGGSGNRRAKSKEQTLAELREENDWKNDLILFWMPTSIR